MPRWSKGLQNRRMAIRAMKKMNPKTYKGKEKISQRLCVNCKKIRKFKLKNKYIGHSECTICGYRYGDKQDE